MKRFGLFKLLMSLGLFALYIDGAEQGGGNTEDTQDPDAQRILDAIANGETDFQEAESEEEVKLPSDEDDNTEEEEPQSGSDDEGELLAGKYKTVDELKKGIKNLKSTLPDYVLNGMNNEALVKHYSELETEFSKGKKHIIKDDKPKEETTEDKPKDTDKPDVAKAIPDDVWSDLSTSFEEKGGLSQEQYDKLESFGIPNQIVDGYLDGLVAKRESFTRDVYQIAGGEEEYSKIKEWALENLDKDYISSLETMSLNQVKNAYKGIKAQYDIANPKTTRIVGGNKSSNSNGSYSSQEAYIRDVQDVRYNTDPSFRKKVDSKLARSKF